MYLDVYRLGRKWTVYIGLCLQGIIALCIRFSPGFEVFIALRFLLGAVSIGGLVTQFTLSKYHITLD